MSVRLQDSPRRWSPDRASQVSAALAAAVVAALAAPGAAQRQFEALDKQAWPTGSDKTMALAAGDVDGDGDIDLIVGNCREQTRLYFNDGTGAFIDATTTRVPVVDDWTYSLVLADVDGDRDVDLVVGNGYRFQEQLNHLDLNDGTGTFADATATRIPFEDDGTRAVALGDVDADGDLDLVAGNFPGQNRLYVNDGTGAFTDATTERMPADNDQTDSLAIGDVDGDGDLDLVIGDFQQQNRLYLNDGTGTFADVTASRMPVDTEETGSLALGDVDEDGDLDVVIGDGLALAYGYFGQNRLYLNDGAGTFTDATAARLPVVDDQTNALAIGDVDGDGDIDLVFGNGGQSHLYLNLLRQLDVPFVLQVGRTYQLDVYARYGPPRELDKAWLLLSTGPASIPLPPLGTLGIAPAPMVALPPFVIPQPAGVGSVVLDIPNNPSLAGIPVDAQALLVQGPVQARLTNVSADVILR